MTEKIIAAIIAGGVSIVVSTIGIIVSLYKVRKDIAIHKQSMNKEFLQKLYEKRLEYYPDIFSATSRLQRRKKPQHMNTESEVKGILLAINKLVNNGGGLFLSGECLNTYRELREALGKNAADGEYYSEQQTEKIFAIRSNFRKCLRKDLLVLHSSQYELEDVIKH